MSNTVTVKAWFRRSTAAVFLILLTNLFSIAAAQKSSSSPSSESQRPSPTSTSTDPELIRAETGAVPSSPLVDGTITSGERGAGEFVLALSDLAGDAEPVTLRGVSSAWRFDLPIPALWQPTQVQLDLSGSFSGALVENSQMVLKVNNHVVQQFALQNENNNFRQVMAIPANLLRSGFNDVRLEVAQYSARASCESAASPELWTQLNLAQSQIRIAANPRPIEEKLNTLSALFDKADWQRRPVVPVMTVDEPTAEELSALGLIAQGVGNRYKRLPVSLRHQLLPKDPASLVRELPDQGRGLILLGTFSNLDAYLEALEIPEQSAPLIAVRALPNDPTKFVLVMAAESEAELASVAAAFAMRQVPWPDHPWVAINKVTVPEGESASTSSPVAKPAAGIVPLKALGFATTTYAGVDEEGTSLRFWNNNWRGRMMVRVHLGYASGMAPQSAFNVLTNGTLHGSIPLNNPDGGRYYNYAVSIPAGALKPGWNTLDFKPILLPVGNGEACPPAGNNLAVTLYDDTIVEQSGGNELQQSDLAVLAGLGASNADGSMGKGIAVHLTDTEASTVSAGMTMIAKMTQMAGTPLLHSWFGVGVQEGMQHHLWVGSYGRLPSQVKQNMPATITGQLHLQVPVMEMASVPAPSDGSIVTTLQEITNFNGAGKPDFKEAQVEMKGPATENSFAYTHRGEGKSFTVFTANSAARLSEGMNEIVAPEKWNQLEGSLAFWSSGGSPVSVTSSADEPFTAYGLRGGLGMWLSHYPWIALAALLLVVTLLVLMTRRTLRFYRKRKD